MDASALSDGKFDVYTHQTMPQRWHFVNNPRIAPIYVVPRMGYVLTDRLENGSGLNNGVRITLPFTVTLTSLGLAHAEPRIRQRV